MDDQIQKLHDSNFDAELGVQQQLDDKMNEIQKLKDEIQELQEEKTNKAASLVEIEEQIMLQ
mgnify:CR=1 FL=1